jgi:hypothetical protein
LVGDVHAQWSAEARFALYYAPPRESLWWTEGCAWLGRDPEAGVALAVPQPPALQRPLPALTEAPRRYGWHGTLVPPFRLAPGGTPQQAFEVARAWAQRQTGFDLHAEAATLGNFVAVCPATSEGDAQMRTLAADALRTLAPLRASLTAADLARRHEAPLTPRQRELLDAWGYPYVFEEFRFHMTLSSSLDNAHERDALCAWWAQRVPQLGALPVRGAALFVEPAPGEPFVLWRRLPFANAGIAAHGDATANGA